MTTDKIITTKKEVSCNGGKLGHPKVYLSLESQGRVVCPYCSKEFILDNKQ